MIKFITFCTLSIFDYFHKKKIIKFLKLNKNHYINLFIDIGAHKGESINFFSDNLKLKKIISFEASKENFKFLKNKYNNVKNVTLENIALSSDISEIFPKNLFIHSTSLLLQEKRNLHSLFLSICWICLIMRLRLNSGL